MIVKHNDKILANLVNLYVDALKNTEKTPVGLTRKEYDNWEMAKLWEYAVMDVIVDGWIDENEKNN